MLKKKYSVKACTLNLLNEFWFFAPINSVWNFRTWCYLSETKWVMRWTNSEAPRLARLLQRLSKVKIQTRGGNKFHYITNSSENINQARKAHILSVAFQSIKSADAKAARVSYKSLLSTYPGSGAFPGISGWKRPGGARGSNHSNSIFRA